MKTLAHMDCRDPTTISSQSPHQWQTRHPSLQLQLDTVRSRPEEKQHYYARNGKTKNDNPTQSYRALEHCHTQGTDDSLWQHTRIYRPETTAIRNLTYPPQNAINSSLQLRERQDFDAKKTILRRSGTNSKKYYTWNINSDPLVPWSSAKPRETDYDLRQSTRHYHSIVEEQATPEQRKFNYCVNAQTVPLSCASDSPQRLNRLQGKCCVLGVLVVHQATVRQAVYT